MNSHGLDSLGGGVRGGGGGVRSWGRFIIVLSLRITSSFLRITHIYIVDLRYTFYELLLSSEDHLI